MNYILFDDTNRTNLFPLTFTRPTAEIRIGILTIREKWEQYLGAKTSFLTEDYLSKKFPIATAELNMLINGSVCPTKELVDQIKELKPGQALFKDEILIADYLDSDSVISFDKESKDSEIVETTSNFIYIANTWDIFKYNAQAINDDFVLLTTGRKSHPISDTNRCLNKENIFIEEGAKVEFSILNASEGPIYIGAHAEVMEDCKIRGPFALGEHAVLKMDAKIYGGTTIGPYSKVGGEVSNSVIFGYSNKAHDGFLGNSVLGEWCNLGADTNTSNLKNNYEEVKLWSYADETFVPTGLQFCGLIMGDHSKSGINTMFNTGTIVGVSANVFGSGFPRNFISSFSWGGAKGFIEFNIKKALKVAQAVYKRRNIEFSEQDRNILEAVYEQTFANRNL
ncbi:MAG: GlmU family protein [Lentimicrobiaceae bacterium]|jgi:UDP-N-acetylglucosamine diphosphorylase/glucosamine-1-phosphate N-acetyltransferase|nr:GlmU family protein [Lentimicrobiaceae bacterium]